MLLAEHFFSINYANALGWSLWRRVGGRDAEPRRTRRRQEAEANLAAAVTPPPDTAAIALANYQLDQLELWLKDIN